MLDVFFFLLILLCDWHWRTALTHTVTHCRIFYIILLFSVAIETAELANADAVEWDEKKNQKPSAVIIRTQSILTRTNMILARARAPPDHQLAWITRLWRCNLLVTVFTCVLHILAQSMCQYNIMVFRTHIPHIQTFLGCVSQLGWPIFPCSRRSAAPFHFTHRICCYCCCCFFLLRLIHIFGWKLMNVSIYINSLRTTALPKSRGTDKWQSKYRCWPCAPHDGVLRRRPYLLHEHDIHDAIQRNIFANAITVSSEV